ncbi:MAG: AtpZ/AtpI family protein [Candidatus Xenobia bacterium]
MSNVEEHIRQRAAWRARRRPVPWPVIVGIGWAVTLCTLIGTIAGQWLDARWHTSISWTLCGMGAGLIIGCIVAWQALRENGDDTDAHQH